jgi:hypothetical protein
MDSEHGMICPASGIMDNQDAQVIRCDPCFAKRDVFDYGVVLAIARACTKRSEWRRPEIGNAVLDPIVYRPDTEIHRTIDLAQPSATLALPAKFNDLQELAGGCGTIGGTRAARRERLLFRLYPGLKIRPFRPYVCRRGLGSLKSRWL